MKLSIVTISFNQAKFLRQCIESVLSQAFSNIEYIIVDPGSTDGSREIIKSYGNQVIAIFEPDQGPADGLNKGFSVATGDVFGFLNSDDALLPGAIESVITFLSKNADVDVVSGCGYFTDAKGNRKKRIVPSKMTPWLYAHGGVSVFQQGTFFRAKSFSRVGGFNTHNSTCWDGELFLDMALAGARFSTLGQDLALFRLHEDSITGSGRLKEKYRADGDRLFKKVTGREQARSDWVLDQVARAAKFLVDPLYFPRRVASLIPSPYR
jgi:glycosyltransferase involved in cell wall biosynthesis